jgi:glutathione S-transferase
MSTDISFDDITLDYLSIAEARKRSGLRLVLGAYAIPGPWREACKGLFDVKQIPYVCVRTANEGAVDSDLGRGNTQSELFAWTAQSSAPVAIWNDEKPRSAWIDQLNLAERLGPEPALVPEGIDLRMRMMGAINEIAGENGLGWNKRIYLMHKALAGGKTDSPDYEFWAVLAAKYGYSEASGRNCVSRMVEILRMLDAMLAEQHARGHRYFIGDRLSALDIYWSTFYAVFDPLPPHLCPMATSYRPAYTNDDPDVARAMTPALAAHRDFIYAEHLRLPVVF